MCSIIALINNEGRFKVSYLSYLSNGAACSVPNPRSCVWQTPPERALNFSFQQ